MGIKGDSPYNIEQEGNNGWLWNAHLNRSSGGTLLNIVEMILSNMEHSSILNFFCNYTESNQWIRCFVKSSIFSSGDYNVQRSRTGWVTLVEGLTGNVITNCMERFLI